MVKSKELVHVDPVAARINQLEKYVDKQVSRISDLEYENKKLQHKIKQLERVLKEKEKCQTI